MYSLDATSLGGNPLAHTNAIGIGIRHAISRALATSNLAPADATWRIVNAVARVDGRGRVVHGEATLDILRPKPLDAWDTAALRGVVNPDGDHPMMVLIENTVPFFIDIFPVTWDRWLRRREDRLPADLDPLCPRTGFTLEAARSFADQNGKRVPSLAEFAVAWGSMPFPWGERSHPTLGRIGAPRFGHLPEVGLHPPSALGLFDLGAWLWHWTEDGLLAGGSLDGTARHGVKPDNDTQPIGVRLVQDA